MRRTKIVSRIAGSFVIMFMVFFVIPVVVKETGLQGLINPIVLFTILLIIPAIGTWISKNKSDIIYCSINIFGFLWMTFAAWFEFADLFP